jgi:small-conductance mechanosensitive channel
VIITEERRSRLILTLSAVAAATLWIAFALTRSDPVLGRGIVHDAIKASAVVATALLAVVALGNVVLSRALGGAAGEPSGFLRVVVYAVLTFAACFVTLRYFGMDVRAVLATSAIVTAAVGFAMQPTLGSMISGLSLHLDGVLRTGDWVKRDDEYIQVTSLNWRTVVGRTTGGRRVAIPNAKLSDDPLIVMPGDQPLETSFYFLATVDARPEQITELMVELMTDLPAVDESRPILVAPFGYDPRQRSLKYRVKYWSRDIANADDTEGEANTRFWYVLQRNRIAYPTQVDCALDAALRARKAETWANPADFEQMVTRGAAAAGLPTEWVRPLVDGGELLLFGKGERLIMPPRTEGWRFLILSGHALISPEFEVVIYGATVTGQKIEGLGRSAAVKKVAEELADYVGPFAEFAVQRAAESARDFNELCRQVAEEIHDANARQRFLAAVLPQGESEVGPGAFLEARRNAAGSLVCGGGLRARSEMAVLAVPPAVAPTTAVAVASLQGA